MKSQDDDLLKMVKRLAVVKQGRMTLSEEAVQEIMKSEAADRLRTDAQIESKQGSE